MTPDFVLTTALDPALRMLQAVGGPPMWDATRIFLLTVMGQESAWTKRRQLGRTAGTFGPARGLCQFERNGGVALTMAHKSVEAWGRRFAGNLSIPWDVDTIYEAIAWNDVLACGFGRLYAYTDPKPLPMTAAEGWDYYLRVWNPGQPRPETWGAYWHMAASAVIRTPLGGPEDMGR